MDTFPREASRTSSVINNKLVTPPPSDGILMGVTRDSVMELARNELGLETVERSIVRSEMYLANEAFFTGTYAGVVPIVEIDNRKIGDGEVGPISAKLKDLYNQAAMGRLPQYSDWYTILKP
jgi:branched-chain amino acid aminotransferase